MTQTDLPATIRTPRRRSRWNATDLGLIARYAAAASITGPASVSCPRNSRAAATDSGVLRFLATAHLCQSSLRKR